MNENKPKTESIWRRALLRLSAIVFGLSLLFLIEGVCRVFRWEPPADSSFVDPGFNSSNPLFVLDAAGDRYSIQKSRLKFFVPESFPARKTERTVRVFCLGGSTVQGRPYSKETSFTTWLNLSLEAADPSRKWEVINCGGVSYASYRLLPILKECLRYEPDLFIVCTGQNEFLEERSYRYVRRAPGWLGSLTRSVMKLRLVSALQYGLSPIVERGGHTAGFPSHSPEADALLDYRDGLKAYQRDASLRRAVIDEFAANVNEMVAVSKSAGVPLLLVSPPSNLRDSPPFKSQHRDGFKDEELARWVGLLEEASKQVRGDLQTTVSLLKQAVAMDDQYARTFYDLGKCYEALAMPAFAKVAFNRARDLDVCPLRILEPMEGVLRAISEETATPIIDAHRILESRSEWMILGNDWLVDHVHPSIQGHQLIAAELVELMARLGWSNRSVGWEIRRDAMFQKHLSSLGELYFLHGQQRLENLRAWTEGRADGPLIQDRLKGSPRHHERP